MYYFVLIHIIVLLDDGCNYLFGDLLFSIVWWIGFEEGVGGCVRLLLMLLVVSLLL